MLYGPLSKIWATMEEELKEDLSDNIELNELCTTFEQTVVLLGQAVNGCNHARRINVLMRFFNDRKKVESLLTDNSEVLEKEKEVYLVHSFKRV